MRFIIVFIRKFHEKIEIVKNKIHSQNILSVANKTKTNFPCGLKQMGQNDGYVNKS